MCSSDLDAVRGCKNRDGTCAVLTVSVAIRSHDHDAGLFVAVDRAVSVRQLVAKVQTLETPWLAALVQGFVYDLVVFLFCFDKEFELFGCQESQFLSEFTKKHFAALLFVTNANDLLCCEQSMLYCNLANRLHSESNCQRNFLLI